MHTPHHTRESTNKSPDGLGGQGNFRHQDDRLAPFLQGSLDCTQINLGLPEPVTP